MKALLVIDNDITALDFAGCLVSCGCECVRYRQPLKAMDNIEEIDPALFIISAIDFPRHWKAIVQFAINTLNTKPVFFLIGENFSTDDEKKIAYLGVHDIISAQIKTPETQKHLLSLLKKYGLLSRTQEITAENAEQDENECESSSSSVPQADESIKLDSITLHSDNSIQTENTFEEPAKIPQETKLEFMFIHPQSGAIITGKTLSRTEDGIMFKPDWEDETSDLRKGDRITSCRLYSRGESINPGAEVLQPGKELELLFI